MEDIAQRFDNSTSFLKLVDRKEAIAKAMTLAEPGNIVLVAGKGHEDYQQIGQTRCHFSDREVILSLSKNKVG